MATVDLGDGAGVCHRHKGLHIRAFPSEYSIEPLVGMVLPRASGVGMRAGDSHLPKPAKQGVDDEFRRVTVESCGRGKRYGVT